ncbi:hypothetical protein LOK49_LG14G00271 [Camellia lanceoleosa]|uniref:Uncharacterized protein n=1 Tax=Camellia lanceoleosa TaxID=1840588 RepID=A0ACC0FAQ5_9ERIC|nr:hypothetical protein LOK49_LG14G00271 [Camellia lanceoleosa]
MRARKRKLQSRMFIFILGPTLTKFHKLLTEFKEEFGNKGKGTVINHKSKHWPKSRITALPNLFLDRIPSVHVSL